MAGLHPGFLTNQGTYLLAHVLSKLSLEGRIDLGQWLGQVPQIMGLTELMMTVGQDLGHRWHQARLLIAEHRQNGPLQVLERCEEGFERGLILLREPATA